MTIRVRLALWYSVILLLGLMLIAAVGYYEMVVAHPEIKIALAEEGHTPIKELSEILLVGGLPAVILAVVGGWFLMRRAMKPLVALTQAVERVQADTLHQRLARTENRDELDRLTGFFNDMMERLNDSFSRVREFTLHASHELKTPLTIMRAELETGLREGCFKEGQRDLLANQLDEIQRLTKIVDSLAFLAKADAGQMAPGSNPVRFDELVRDIFTDAQILAQPRKIAVALTVCDEVMVQGDRHRLRQLLLNLIDNAVKFNRPEGTVSISLTRAIDTAELKISNTGPGIAAEKLSRVFDRFYRGDPAHNSGIEGCGLGLSIVQWIAKAHRGTIRIESEPEQWTNVIVVLPTSDRLQRIGQREGDGIRLERSNETERSEQEGRN